jgi:hypothetical protein
MEAMHRSSQSRSALLLAYRASLRYYSYPAARYTNPIPSRTIADLSGGGIRSAVSAVGRDAVETKVAGSKPDNKARTPSMGAQIRDLNRSSRERSGMFDMDREIASAAIAPLFPRLEMTCLAGNEIFIQEAARDAKLTLVLLAFRSFADSQLASWRDPFEAEFHMQSDSQIFDVSVNETISAQALCGFVQRLQRRHVDKALHNYYVALNGRASDSLEAVLPSTNRFIGYALLLDNNAKVRFRTAGMADEASIVKLLDAARQLRTESNRPSSVLNGPGNHSDLPSP